MVHWLSSNQRPALNMTSPRGCAEAGGPSKWLYVAAPLNYAPIPSDTVSLGMESLLRGWKVPEGLRPRTSGPPVPDVPLPSRLRGHRPLVPILTNPLRRRKLYHSAGPVQSLLSRLHEGGCCCSASHHSNAASSYPPRGTLCRPGGVTPHLYEVTIRLPPRLQIQL